MKNKITMREMMAAARSLLAQTYRSVESIAGELGYCSVFDFSAKFKSELVIELLKGEKDLNTIAAENNIQPNLLRNWKKEFLDKASVVFDDTREENLKEKLASERREKAEYAKKVGQLTMQVDWLKKKSEETLGPDYESKFSPKPFED